MALFCRITQVFASIQNPGLDPVIPVPYRFSGDEDFDGLSKARASQLVGKVGPSGTKLSWLLRQKCSHCERSEAIFYFDIRRLEIAASRHGLRPRGPRNDCSIGLNLVPFGCVPQNSP